MASKTIRDITRLINEARVEREAANAELEKWRLEVQQWDESIAAYERTLQAVQSLEDTEDDSGMPAKQIRNEMMKILRDYGEPMHYGAIFEELGRRGISVPGKDPRRNVGAHLSNDDRFESLGQGQWGLVSWNESEATTPWQASQRNVVDLRERTKTSPPERLRQQSERRAQAQEREPAPSEDPPEVPDLDKYADMPF